MTAFVLVVVAVALAAALVVSWPLLRAAPVPHAPWIAAAAIPVAVTGVWLLLRESAPSLPTAPAAGAAARVAPREGDDGESWSKRGRAHAMAGRFAEAAAAYEEATRRLPPNASLLAERADTLAMARGRRFEGEPDRLIAEALALDPRHVKALALSGTSAYTRGDFPSAARQWRTLLAVLPPGSDMAREVGERLADTERQAKGIP